MSDELPGLGGQTFYKMTGSGNDFIFFDARSGPIPALQSREAVARLCARGTGVGADGVVFLTRTPEADIGIRYYNSDGSDASLCGNATLCTTRLAVDLGAAAPEGFTIATDAGVVQARISKSLPQFDLPAARDIQLEVQAIPRLPNERRLGYVITGVPHIVIVVDDVESVDVIGRGAPIRYHSSLPEGANVNFVAPRKDGSWAIRTYERGVEGETLACGTGNAASAVLLKAWGEISGDQVTLWTKSGQPVDVTLSAEDWRDTGAYLPSLRGEGRLVYRGELAG